MYWAVTRELLSDPAKIQAQAFWLLSVHFSNIYIFGDNWISLYLAGDKCHLVKEYAIYSQNVFSGT